LANPYTSVEKDISSPASTSSLPSNMSSRLPTHSPSASEGEIIESDTDKATKSHRSTPAPSIDRQDRKPRFSATRSPSPVASIPISRLRSRSRSRSPFRASRRAREDDNHGRLGRHDDTRRFKVHYEDSHGGRNKTSQENGERGTKRGLGYDDRRDHGRSKRPRTTSRSPPRFNDKHHDGHNHTSGSNKNFNGERSAAHCRQQSVSDRGSTPLTAGYSIHEAKTSKNQVSDLNHPEARTNGVTDKYVFNVSESLYPNILPSARISITADLKKEEEEAEEPEEPLDEAALIEKRRKRREAIKAKYQGSNTPLLVQAINHASLNSTDTSNTPAAAKRLPYNSSNSTLHGTPVATPQNTPPQTPKEPSEPNSPAAFDFYNDENLANNTSKASGSQPGDEPSAADYDPTMDMQEEKRRHDSRNNAVEVSSAAYDETKNNKQDVLIPDKSMNPPPQKKEEDEFDMFADGDDDMFAEAPPAPRTHLMNEDTAKALPVPRAKALDMSMLDDWDDEDGYYKVILGELLEGRYHVQSNLGKGMFSGVVRAMDQTTNKLVAIKIIRSNETMKKAGVKEIEILEKLMAADPEDKKHLIRLERSFEHKGHLCMVFENLNENLREVLKKFGRDVGINLKAVRIYAQQMFLGLSLMRRCNILHADLKPDNVLVNESRNMLKICDLGSASDATENDITPYLVSRFYRAPEIILGMPYDFAIDVWSIGCTLFELFTGKILFTGRTNNQMLRAIMDCRGKLSHKMLKKAEFAGLHFDDMLNFRSIEIDKLSGKDVVRVLNIAKPTRDLRTRVMANMNGGRGMAEAEVKEVGLFVDLLEKCLNLNPEKRCTPAEALRHPFIMRTK
jgi:serine/threonine-protein kinase PRP4